MKLRNLTILLIAVFILNIGTAFSQNLDINDQSGDVDDLINFTLSINNAPDAIDSLQFDILYDTGVLEFTGNFIKDDLVKDFNFFDIKEIASGQIRVAGITPVDLELGVSGNIATLEFKVKRCSNSILTLDNLEGDISDWSTGDGQFICAGDPPVFDDLITTVCDKTLTVEHSNLLSFTIQASDSDPAQTVTLITQGMPPGAIMAPALPAKGNPVSSVFSWTPLEEQKGTHPITFSAVDGDGLETMCSVTIEVIGPNGTDTPLKASFDSDPLAGFKPLTVNFTDKSQGNPTSWAWEFGDGDISNEQNPTHVYQESGIFTVKLTVSNSEGSETAEKVNLIDVKDVGFCKAAFNTDKTTGFAPLEVKFTDKSTGNPTSWAWEFGDGAISSEQNPTHLYQIPGIFTVRLTISADCGADVITRTNLINVPVMAPVNPEFSATPTSGFAPLPVQFTDLTAGEPASWAWDFGDGAISSEQNPVHIYIFPGLFTVTLTASNENGAGTEIKTNLINVFSTPAPTAEFEASPLTGFAPLQVIFTDTSAGNISNWNWDFGDSSTSILQNPVHEYKNPGFFNVKLTVSGIGGTGFEEKTNVINVIDGLAPTASFIGEPLAGNASFTVHFFDVSSGEIVNWSWDFGDGIISTEQNPVHTYNSPGNFSVKLTVSGQNGTSEESKTNFITVIRGNTPTAAFTADKKTGVSPGSNELTVQFADLSSSPANSINKWEWNFGDGSKSDEQNPLHIYKGSEDDTFTVSLTVEDSIGMDTITRPAFINLKEAEPTVTPTPTPTPSLISSLTVSPETSNRSLRFQTAIVTTLDQNGQPVEGTNIVASASGTLASVTPASAVTSANAQPFLGSGLACLGKTES